MTPTELENNKLKRVINNLIILLSKLHGLKGKSIEYKFGYNDAVKDIKEALEKMMGEE